MKLKEKTVTVNFIEAFNLKTKYRFNCLRLGTAFKKDISGLIVGGEDGIIRVYDLTGPVDANEPQLQLETKGGPIQTLIIHDVTKFYNEDIVTGDSLGMVTVFCNQQILSRHQLTNSCIRSIQIYKDALGNSCIITSDESGYICALLPSKDLWRINVNNLSVTKGPSQKTLISSMLCTDLVSPTGETCTYILAADDSQHLHIVHQGEVVMTMMTPHIVTAMCCGQFIDKEKLDIGQDIGLNKDMPQIALGCANGAIHILHNFTITEEEFTNAKYNITHLSRYPSSTGKIDHILCAGNFSALYVYHEGKRVGNYEMSDWVNSLDILFSDPAKPVVVGCLDNTIHGLNLLET